MGFWYYFWTVNFVVSGTAFLLITLIVAVRGTKDLRDMFARLDAGNSPPEPGTPRDAVHH